MLIDSDKHPQSNVYFIGARLLAILKMKRKFYGLEALFEKFNDSNVQKISFDYMLLSLDWLYLLGILQVNEKGDVRYVS